mmetsp:Transcript_40202/g.97036  ORF Transcript_40202/g.97036 Transcript_40202/m.97036 type:complete len:656 (+) Transcript_40202:156-2123(+)
MENTRDHCWSNNCNVALDEQQKTPHCSSMDDWNKFYAESSIGSKQGTNTDDSSFGNQQHSHKRSDTTRQRSTTLDQLAQDINALDDTSIESEDSNNSNTSNSNNIIMKTSIERQWSLGRVSVLLFVFISLTDVILHLADAKMDSLESIEEYDALSSEVIRPAFQYTSNTRTSSKAFKGSETFSSLTFVLDPIISSVPSDSGWLDGVVESLTSAMYSARDSLGLSDHSDSTDSILNTPRGGTSIAVASKRKRKTLKKSHHTFTLSNTDPFVSLRDIAQLTLRDVAMAFRFALENTRKEFNKNKFISKASPRVKKAFEQMSTAAAQSRGKYVKAPNTASSNTKSGLLSGDIDALQFCAAMRIFAEWRVVRQVPEGYKGYAVGMSLGQKDIVQNVAKIEHAVHTLIEHRENELALQEGSEEEEVQSPTLRDLLQFEVDTKVHGSKLPKLKEKSAAMGLLWVRRQLHYQTALFKNVIKVPQQFESSTAAVTAAYSEVYDKFHGWAIQKIFNYSFQAAPDAREIYNYMNPDKLKKATEEARTVGFNGQVTRRQPFSMNKKEKENPLDRFGKHIGNEWGKITNSVMRLFGKSESSSKSMRSNNSAREMDSNEASAAQEYIDDIMKTDAHEQILEYLQVAQPLLLDLANLFDEFNMDDPTKV